MLPKRLCRTPIYESKWINLYLDKVEYPSGQIIEKYHQLDYPFEAVSVLVVNTLNEICLIRSLRYTTQKIQWELPAGRIENDEDIIAAGRRELLEETGITTGKLECIFSYYPSPGMSNNAFSTYYGFSCSASKQLNRII